MTDSVVRLDVLAAFLNQHDGGFAYVDGDAVCVQTECIINGEFVRRIDTVRTWTEAKILLGY